MSFIVEVSTLAPFPVEAVFDRLADHATWGDWMPRTFRPASPSVGTLKKGSVVKVRIPDVPFPTPLSISVFERPREISWLAGNFLLGADHRILFEAVADGQTRIRSVETWSGLLSPLLAPFVRRVAAKNGLELIEELAKGMGKK